MTEKALHQQWRSRLAGIPSLLPDGWYQPPATGTSVLIGQPPGFARTNFRSLRHPVNLPRARPAAGPGSILFVYSSPVDRATAMIGDFQMTIYAGDDVAVRDHLAATLRVSTATAAFAEPGMEMRELYQHSVRIMAENDVVNDTHSTTDGSGLQNIGHTLPWSHTAYDDRIWDAIDARNTAGVSRIVRQAIALIGPRQRLRIAGDMALTIEPQVLSRQGVQASFHIIVSFLGGQKSVHTDFSEIFAHCGMTDYLAAEEM